jgi:hypothetical protein
LRLYTIIALLLLVVAPVQAHQQKAAFSQLLLNPRTGLLEVAHRFLLHDAEHAVQQLFDSKADIIADPATQQRFADYVVARFAITQADGSDLALEYVGVELDRSFIWVYQEAKPPVSSPLTISHSALLDVWSGQENMVNIEGLGELKTLYFEAHRDTLTIDLE